MPKRVKKLKFNYYDPELNEYHTGTGAVINRVHTMVERCLREGCVIHNPTDPHKDWPTHWREDRKIMERICTHGVGHPDRDHLNWVATVQGVEYAEGEAIHGCCPYGCCALPNLPIAFKP